MRNPYTLGCLRVILAALTLTAVAGAALGDDWTQWRGPKRDGISQEKGLLKEWPQGGPALVWQVNGIGFGYSTPVVVGSRIYLLSNDGPDNEYVVALDAKDGKRIWTATLGKVGNPEQMPHYPGARSTPTVDGPVLYALGSDGDLACVETAGGKVRWKKSLRTDFGGKPGTWAYSESPLVDGNTLVCTPGGATATMVALDKRNGNVIWQCAVPGGDPAAYASPAVMVAGGIRQYVQVVQNGIIGVEAKSGKFLWRYDKVAKGSPVNIPTPVADSGCVYTSAPRGGALVRPKADHGAVTAEEVYQASRLPNAIGGSVKVGNYLYGVAGQALVCVEFLTGSLKWDSRGVGAASVLAADGLLYLHGENGDVALVEATPEGYREHGRFTPPNPPKRGDSKAWAYPVIANGRLYLRDLDVLYCYNVRTPL